FAPVRTRRQSSSKNLARLTQHRRALTTKLSWYASLVNSRGADQAARKAHQDQHEQHQPNRHEGEAQDLGPKRHRSRRRLHEVFAQLTGFEQAIVLEAVLALELLQRHGAREHDDVERKILWPPVIVEEMYREQ